MPEQTPQKGRGEVTLYLSTNQRGLIPVPVELQRIIPDKLWNDRINTASRTASRYSKPMFERIWTFLALVSIIVLPLVLVPVIANVIDHGKHHKDSYYYGIARGIGFAIFIGIGLLFFIPVFVWKLIGRIQVRKLLRHWAAEDRIMMDQSGFIPTWTIKTPSVFRARTILTVTTPPAMGATLYHPAAYLPSYINAPNPPEEVLYRVPLNNEAENPFADFEKVDGRGDVRNV